METRPTHLIDLPALGRAAFDTILESARRWRSRQAAGTVHGARVATLFEGAAFRTRLAFDAAIADLGARRVDLPPGVSGREPSDDFMGVLSHYADALVIRIPDHDALLDLAASSPVPVVNAMTSRGHPCEVISECMTLVDRFGSVDGLRVAFVGADGNLCRSWLEAASLFDIEVTQVCPEGWEAPDQAFRTAAAGPGRARVVHDLVSGVAGVDVVYTDVRPAAARTPGDAQQMFAPFRVDAAALDRAASRAVLMHCMPVRRGEEVTADAFAGPRSITLASKANLGPSHTAILEHVLSAGP